LKHIQLRLPHTFLENTKIGEVVGGFKMLVGGMNFEKNHSYSNGDLLTTKLRFVIKEIEPILKENKI